MSYEDRFIAADELITHLDSVFAGVPNPLLQSKYVGFLAVSAVTVYELAVKDILINFAKNKHAVFGSFTAETCARLNGRIKREHLEDEFIVKFGSKYKTRFKKMVDRQERLFITSHGVSIKNCYSNIITWRNQFAHEGVIPAYATYDEVKNSYQHGKTVIKCLFSTLVR